MSNVFSASIATHEDVPGDVEQVYSLLRDPEFVGRSTPFIRRITPLADDVWWWELGGINHPGGSFSAGFTQRMTFDPPREIGFAHDPSAAPSAASSASGKAASREIEAAGADGAFRLVELQGGRVRVRIDMAVEARVPAPRRAAPVVESAIGAVVALMGDRFTVALRRELEMARGTS